MNHLLLICIIVLVYTPFGTAFSATQDMSASQLWEQGLKFSQKGSSKKKAEGLLREALKIMPDNANLQVDYYYSLYALALDMDDKWYAQLEAHFNVMHPVAKSIVTPPAFIKFLHAHKQKQSVKKKIKWLQSAIQQQSESYLVWHNLSIILENNNQIHAALQASLIANKYIKNQSNVQFQAGYLYDVLARQGCRYDNIHYTRKAVEYITKAVSITPNNKGYYWDVLSDLYIRLGLFPLARSAAEKAFVQSRFAAYEALVDVHILQGNYKKAEGVFKQTFEPLKRNIGAKQRSSTIHMGQSNWQRAYNSYQDALKRYEYVFQDSFFGQWLYVIFEQKKPKVAAFIKSRKDFNPWKHKSADSDWEKLLKAYMGDKSGHAKSLVEVAKDVCQATEAHFYTAMKHWQNKNFKQSKEQLQEVLNQKAYGFKEYAWAKALLDSDAFLMEQEVP